MSGYMEREANEVVIASQGMEGARAPVRAVRFILPTNLRNSMARITADLANVHAKRGVQVTVYYPLIDWIDLKWAECAKASWRGKVKRLPC